MTIPLYKLDLLKYPRAGKFDIANEEETVALVAFLEDRHVRQWPIERRTQSGLRKTGTEWPAVFEIYLREAECPLLEGGAAFAGERLAAYVTWLVGRAVSADYEERAKELNDGAAAELRGDPLHIAQPPLSVPPAAEAAVRELAALVDVNVEGRDALQALQAVHRTLRQRVLPAAQLAEAQQRDAAAATAGEAADVAAPAAGTVPVRVRRQGVRRDVGATTLTSAEALDATRFPVGFSTGSAVIDKAATLLRMLYIADLRELQDAVNDILVTVQEFTANPKTDASLGLVGR